MRKVIVLITAGLIVLVGAWWRFDRLDHPSDYVFDEVYHVPTADLISKNDPRAYQWWHKELLDEYGPGAYVDWLHPPAAKLLQALSIKLLGNNAWGWRLPSALMGTLLIIIVYGMTKTMCDGRNGPALLAAALVAVDGLAIAQSRITMNDIFVTVWIALAIWCYRLYLTHQRQRYLFLLALTSGLAIASKWSGVFIFGFIATWQLWEIYISKKSNWLTSVALLVFTGGSSAILYLLAYGQMFYFHNWRHWWQLHYQILRYQFLLDAEHPYASPAWQWPLALKPVALYYDAQTDQHLSNQPFYPSWYFSFVSLMIAPIWVSWQAGRRFKKKNISFTGFLCRYENFFFLLIAYGWMWLPWIGSPRIMYFHHYLPALPFLWALTGWTWDQICDYFCHHDRK